MNLIWVILIKVPWLSLLKLLLSAAHFAEKQLIEAAERKKAGNLLEIQAAVSDFKTAKTPGEKDEATKRIQSAFESR